MGGSPPQGRQTTSGAAWMPFGLFALILLVYLPALWCGFVWDDLTVIVGSDRLRSWGAIIEVFRHPAMWSAGFETGAIGTFRPIALASVVVDIQLFGENPTGFHLTSLILHAFTVVLVFMLFKRWVSPNRAFALALLFRYSPDLYRSRCLG